MLKMNIWETLGISPTTDIKEIKSAYAKLAKQYNPEEKPEEFKRIFDAYRAACSYAKRVHKNLTVSVEQTHLAESESNLNNAKNKSEPYDFSAVNTEHFTEAGITDIERERRLLEAIKEIISDKNRYNDIQTWKEFFAAKELEIFIFDPIFRIEAYDILAEALFSPETASIIASGFGRGSRAVPVTEKEWRVIIGKTADRHSIRKKNRRRLSYADVIFILVTASFLISFLELVISTKFGG